MKYILGVVSAILILTISCIDPIDFAVPTGLSDSIVVQGRVVKGESSFVEIAVSRLFDFSPESRQPVSVREVIFFDDQGNEMLLETRTPGFYKQVLDSSTPIQANVGTGYHIRLTTFDNRVYESTSDIMLPNSEPQGIGTRITQVEVPDIQGNFVQEDRILLTIDTEVDNSSDGGLYWEVNNVYKITDSGINDPDGVVKTCYINKTANTNEIYVLDPAALAGGSVSDYELVTSPLDFRFAEGLFFEVRQYSLSRGAFRYWNGIDILSEREGNMFDGPVGEIQSNLVNLSDPDDFVFGYFFATDERIVRHKVEDNLVGNVRTLCPSASACFAGPGGDCICGLCCDCLIEEVATTTPPDFWRD